MTFPGDINEILTKTRVLLFSGNENIVRFFAHVLSFHRKEVDFYGKGPLTGADFIVFPSSDTGDASLIKANILLADSATSQAQLDVLATSVTSGGVLIFPDELSFDENIATAYYRRLPFEKPVRNKSSDGRFMLETMLGEIPVSNDILLKDIAGLQLLAQQFGIMEEEFYEALLEYETV